MKRLFTPAILVANKLRIPQKFMGLALICLFAVAAVSYSLYRHLGEAIAVSQQELDGIALIKPLTRTMQLLQEHRGLSGGVLGGDESNKAALADNEVHLEAALEALTAQLSRAPYFTEEWQPIQINWDGIRKDGSKWSANKSFVAHSELLAQMLDLRRHIADRQALSFDPDLGAHYLLDTAIVELPVALEKIGQIRGLGTAILARNDLSANQKFRMHALIGELQTARKSLHFNLTETARYSPIAGARLTSAFEEFDLALKSLLDSVHSDILSEHFEANSSDFFQAATVVVDKGYKQLYETMLPTAEDQIAARMARARETLFVSDGVGLILMLVVCYFFVGIYYSTVGSIKSLADSAQRFASGDLSQRVNLNTRDELHEVGDSFNHMADGFTAQLVARFEGEERMRAIVGSALDALIQMDADGSIAGWSNQAEAIFGWNRSEAVGRMLHETIIPERYREKHLSGLKHFLASGEGPVLNTRIEIEGLHRDGHEFSIELSISSIKTAHGIEFNAFVRDISARKQADAELKLRATSLKNQNSLIMALLKNLPVGVLMVEAPSGKPLIANETALGLLGKGILPDPSGESLAAINRTYKLGTFDLYPVEDTPLQLAMSGISSHVDDMVVERPGGAKSLLEVFGSPVMDDDGRIFASLSSFIDITKRRASEDQLHKLSLAVEQSPESIVITNLDGAIEYVNEAFIQNTGYSREEVMGKNPSILHSGNTPPDTFVAMWESLTRGQPWKGELYNRRKDGGEFLEHAVITPIRQPDGMVTHYVAVKEDITARKASEVRINTLAFYDPLTSLPNRRLLLDRLKQALASSARNKSHGALLFIDLDNFKTLNDTLGHEIGDLLLQQVAQRLTTCVREGDTVARLGGDEFVVMLADLSENIEESAAQTKTVGEKVLAALNQPYQLGNYPHHSTPSIGVTLFSNQQETTDELLKRADLAMYQAKTAGRNTLRFFDPEMQAVVTARAAMEADLREAVLKGHLLLHYQAQVAGEGRVTGVEVLLRWQHPQRGMVSPADFIPLAEDTGLILPIGHWVLQTACVQLAIWATRPEMAHLTIAVNVSARQFRQGDFVDQVQAVLGKTRANPRRLKLELTESLLVHSVDEVIEKMVKLKSVGVGFSLDDFGTGYSSLSYLKRLPLDQLKIDQSFVRDLLDDPNNLAIAKTIVTLAQSLGLGVIAEGVETAAQRDFLSSVGCSAYQGYFFSRPLPLVQFEDFAQRGLQPTQPT